MTVIRQLRAAGEDPAEAGAGALASSEPGRRGEFGTGNAVVRWATVLMDVEGIMQQLGPHASAEQVAARLCPWSSDGGYGLENR